MKNARFRIDGLAPGRAATTTIGGMPDPDGRARIRQSKSAQVQFYVYGGAGGATFTKVALFTRPVTVGATKQPRAAGCGGANVKHAKWKAAGPPLAQEATPIDTGRIWDLQVAPNKRHFITLGANPGTLDDDGAVTFIVQLVESNGTEHWLESDAVELEHGTCVEP